MNIISSNPYRLLGIYSNSPAKDRIANANKLKAYLKVGKSVSFPLDLLNFVSTPFRTVESIEHAQGSINLFHSQLKYALFWFIKVSPIDEIALGYLQNGDTDKAKDLFNKKETFSSLINLGVLSLIQNDKAVGIQAIAKVIHNEDYRDAFIEAVCDGTYQLSEDELAQLFMEELSAEISIQELMRLFLENGIAKDYYYLKNKAVSESIANINTEIAIAKKVKNDAADAQYKAGTALINNTKDALSLIRSLLQTNDMQYQMVADNLAKQILQCGINYYNNSKESDAAIKAMPIQKYALLIAVGALIKDRCKENVDILQKIVNELPPLEVLKEDAAIKVALANFSRARKPWKRTMPFLLYRDDFEPAVDDLESLQLLLRTVSPYLQIIKSRVGNAGDYYWKVSELIVNCVLSDLIDYVNTINNSQLQYMLLSDREQTLRKLRAVVKNSMQIIIVLDTFDMTSKFRTVRYSPNKNTLMSLRKQLNMSEQSSQAANSGCMVWIVIAVMSLIAVSCI